MDFLHFSDDGISVYDLGFPGHEHIDRFDMINMDGRMYDPVVGHFMSPDPYVQAPDFTQSLNRYAYCINNPLSLTDPSGYNWIKNTFASIVGIAVGIETGGLALEYKEYLEHSLQFMVSKGLQKSSCHT